MLVQDLKSKILGHLTERLNPVRLENQGMFIPISLQECGDGRPVPTSTNDVGEQPFIRSPHARKAHSVGAGCPVIAVKSDFIKG
jgi:hypothetical protein